MSRHDAVETEVARKHWVHRSQHINLVGEGEGMGYVVSWRDGDRTEHDTLLEARRWIDKHVWIKNAKYREEQRRNNGDSRVHS